MTDHELLEKAAKAIGREIHHWSTILPGPMLADPVSGECSHYWNPLSEDGDALRLAVTLGLECYHTINGDEWTAFVGYPSNGAIKYAFEGYGSDPMAATRRAVVRAAAAIGELK